MIRHMRGKLVSLEGHEAVIEVYGGIGIVVNCSYSLYIFLEKELGNEVVLNIEMLWIKEQAPLLLGYKGRVELEWFSSLHKVQGIGIKTALALISDIPIIELRRLLLGEVETVGRVRGLGTKTLRRLRSELGEKVRRGELGGVEGSGVERTGGGVVSRERDNVYNNCREALLVLGYRAEKVDLVLASMVNKRKVEEGGEEREEFSWDTGAEADLIRYALSQLS